MKNGDCLKWLWKASEGIRGRIVAASCAGIVHVAASLAFVYICKKLIDSVTLHGGEGASTLAGCMILCMLIQVCATAVETRLTSYTDVIFKNRLRYNLFTGLLDSRWDGKEVYHSGDALNRMMEDVRVVAEALTRSVPAALTAGVQFLAAFVFLYVLEPALAWLVPGVMLIMLLLSKSYIRRMRKLNRNIRQTESDMHALMQESLHNRIVIHTFERSPYISDSLAEHQEDLRGHVVSKTRYSVFTHACVQAGFAAGYASAFLWGAFGILSGAATFGMMTAFLQLVSQIQRPVMNLSRQLPSLINSLTSAERLAGLSSLPQEETGMPVNLGNGVGVRFDNVSFAYPDSSSALFEGFSHDFRPGSVTAMMGETGAGKSTLMRLMLGLLRPDEGHVLLYNEEQTLDAGPDSRCNLIYVPQGNTLMSGTIRDNLLLGNPDAQDDELIEALHVAAADFVMELPDGLDTVCGERGAGLSEGQAQRIAIARALLRSGGVILLDEPTASLDLETERILLQRLSSSRNGRTLIIITHREEVLALCDDVIRI